MPPLGSLRRVRLERPALVVAGSMGLSKLSGSWPFRRARAGNLLEVSETDHDDGVDGGMTGMPLLNKS